VTAMTTGALSGAPSVPELWRARDALRAAVDNGADLLQVVLDAVEDELVEELAERRRARRKAGQ
jgi:biotin synthase-related radical SAM superfamily protein